MAVAAAHRSIVRPEMDGRPQAQPQRSVSGQQPVGHSHGVLPVGEEEALFQHESIHFVAPHRQAGLQAERGQWEDMFRRDPRQLLGACVVHPAVRQAQALGEPVEHHHAALWIGQGRDQQAVVAARNSAAHCAGGIAPQAVGDQPLLSQVGIRGRIGERSFGQHSNQVSHSSAGSTGRMTMAAWAGIRHSPPPSTFPVPPPP